MATAGLRSNQGHDSAGSEEHGADSLPGPQSNTVQQEHEISLRQRESPLDFLLEVVNRVMLWQSRAANVACKPDNLDGDLLVVVRVVGPFSEREAWPLIHGGAQRGVGKHAARQPRRELAESAKTAHRQHTACHTRLRAPIPAGCISRNTAPARLIYPANTRMRSEIASLHTGHLSLRLAQGMQQTK